LREIVPDAVPIERRLAANVQPFESALKLLQARIQFERRIRSSEYAARQARKPTRADVVNRKVRRDAHCSQFLRGYRASGLHFPKEVV